MWQSLSKGHFSHQLVFPIGKFEQDYVYEMITHYTSCQQCKPCQQCQHCQQCKQCKQYIAQCYLHLWWYFSHNIQTTYCVLTGLPMLPHIQSLWSGSLLSLKKGRTDIFDKKRISSKPLCWPTFPGLSLAFFWWWRVIRDHLEKRGETWWCFFKTFFPLLSIVMIKHKRCRRKRIKKCNIQVDVWLAIESGP